MAILAFPPIDQADENGLLAFGGDLEVSSLRLAYSQGIFPWPIGPNYPLAWFSPNPRGILYVDDLHLSRSLRKYIKQRNFTVTFNRCFGEVILACAQTPNRKTLSGHNETWITPQIIDSYLDFHHAGNAYSIEVWHEQELVGGLYGVRIGRAICGESMFHSMDNASKIALLSLALYLKANQIPWLDTQMVTSVVANMGGKEIARDQYIKELSPLIHLDGDDLFSKNFQINVSDLID